MHAEVTRLHRPLSTLVGLAVVLVLAPISAKPDQHVIDHGEYDLIASIQQEHDAARRLTLLQKWEQVYPKSGFRQERYGQFIAAFQVFGDSKSMLDVARRMAADDPYGVGNYWIAVLTISVHDTSPEALEQGRRAAQALLHNSAHAFARERCPAAVPLIQWNRERDRQMLLAHRTLGWVALQDREYPEATREFTTLLRAQPQDAEASFWLGTALVGQNRPEFQSAAVFHFAHALGINGKGALSKDARPLVQKYFEQVYEMQFGTQAGMSTFIQRARLSPFPPRSNGSRRVSVLPVRR